MDEKEILSFWVKKKIYEKSKKKNAKGKKFYFMDGPPYATGHIHMGTALNKISKDISMRARRLQGFDVFDRPGYDTHGVPIELQVEKEIGSRRKQDIEKYGVKKFILKCKDFATRHIDVMNNEFINLGVWMDWENPYLTLDDSYIEAIWDAFKQADKKSLLYLGKYPVHVCPRCETAVAFNEIEYAKQKDTSVYVKFPLVEKKNTFLLIWTTTPWTLPANTGVMVNPNVDYQEVEVSNGEKWIIAKELVGKVMGMMERGYTVKSEIKGKKMEGWKYENPLAKNLKLNIKNGYKILLSSRYVTTEDGTGLVHSAPGHGKEDYEVGKEYGIDMPSPVGVDGLMTAEAGKYKGKKARVVDAEIISDLEKDGFLVHKVEYEHDYPLCWRDKTPLLMISMPQWFLKISEIQKKLLKHNEDTNWVPDYMKLRMKAWLEGIGDWPVSRQRYWGTPLPIWISDDGDIIVVGSIEELKKLSGVKNIKVHKPEIDKIEIKKNGKIYRRVPEVLDVWFDSGVSSWAALDYPHSRDKFNKFWPADLNVEGKDQFRGWWNSQLILSEIAFGKKPFDNILVHGMVTDISKKKLSKSSGNAIAPEKVIEKYSRDYLRYYFAKLSKGEDFSYDEKEFKEIQKVFMILENINSFVNQLDAKKGHLHIEDRWILSRFNSLVKDVTESYNNYKFPEVVLRLEEFVILDLSRKYIQIIRDRSEEVYSTLNQIRVGLLKLFAPIMPFTTEKIWQELYADKIVKEESVHLSDWTKADLKKIDKKLEKEFEIVSEIIEKGLAARDSAKIGLRWPLMTAYIKMGEKIDEDLLDIVKSQLNVKNVDLKSGSKEILVELNTEMTPELEAEGYAREISRKIQAGRKKSGLVKNDKIKLGLVTDSDLKELLGSQIDFIKERVNAADVLIKSDIEEKKYKNVFSDEIKGNKIKFMFSKV